MTLYPTKLTETMMDAVKLTENSTLKGILECFSTVIEMIFQKLRTMPWSRYLGCGENYGV